MRPNDCENYPATEIITYFVQPVNVWASSRSMLIVCRLSTFPVCRQVSQQPQVYQTIWQQSYWRQQLKKRVNNVIIDITFTSLTANGLALSIVLMSICWTHIMKVWVCVLVRSQLSKTAAACHRRLSIANHRHEHEYAPVPVQWCRCWECREQLTPIVCDRRRHMPVIGEGLQTGSSLPSRGEEMAYLGCQRDLGWKQHHKSEPRHCMS